MEQGHVSCLTPVVNVTEWRVDELAQVAHLLCDVHQQRDGIIAAAVQVEESFGQTRLPRGGLWREEHKDMEGETFINHGGRRSSIGGRTAARVLHVHPRPQG